MAYGNFGYGIGVGDQTRCSSGYLYIPAEEPDIAVFDNDCLVDTIKVDIQDIGGNDQLRLYHGYESGGSFVFHQYDPIVTLTLDSTTGWRTFTAPTDFTAFNVSAGDVIGLYAHNDDCRPGRSNTGANTKYFYSSGDPPYSSSLSLSNNTTRRVELKIEGPAGGVTPGWNRIEYTNEPPTPNAWNQVKREAGTGWRKLEYG